MEKLAMLLPALAVLCLLSHAQTEEPMLRVCLVSGCWEYDSDTSLAAFQEYLEAHYQAQCTLIKARDPTDLPGLEALEDCDVALFFTRRLEIMGEQLERVKQYCEAGRPMVGVRTASHGFQNWLEFDKLVLGGNYQGHYGEGPIVQAMLVPEALNHPVLAGVLPFTSVGSLYQNTPLAKDTELLMVGEIPDHTEPIAWTRLYKGARIFYTSLGHPEDFNNDSFRRLLANALFWTVGREPAEK